MAAPWDRRAQRAEIPKLAITPAIPPFPGQAATVGVGTSGKLPGSAKPDHTHPAQDTSAAGLTTNRLLVKGINAPGSVAGAQVLISGSVREDPLAAWNNATGTWTPPVAGIYLFIFKVKYTVAAGTSKTISTITPLLHQNLASARETTNTVANAVHEYCLEYRSYLGEITPAFGGIQFFANSDNPTSTGVLGDISIFYLGA